MGPASCGLPECCAADRGLGRGLGRGLSSPPGHHAQKSSDHVPGLPRSHRRKTRGPGCAPLKHVIVRLRGGRGKGLSAALQGRGAATQAPRSPSPRSTRLPSEPGPAAPSTRFCPQSQSLPWPGMPGGASGVPGLGEGPQRPLHSWWEMLLSPGPASVSGAGGQLLGWGWGWISPLSVFGAVAVGGLVFSPSHSLPRTAVLQGLAAWRVRAWLWMVL